MSQQRTDVNEYLGSWGPQPEDAPRLAAPWDPTHTLAAEDWGELAQRWGNQAILEVTAGHAQMAGECARGAARFALWYQRMGGRPDAE